MSEVLNQLIAIPGFCVDASSPKTGKNGTPYTEISMKYTAETPDSYPKCGEKLYKHGYRIVTVVDTPMLGQPCRLNLSVPRKRCKCCQNIWMPSIKGVDEKRSMTDRAFLAISQKALSESFESVSAEYMVAPNTVKNTFQDFVKEKQSSLRFKTPVFLGLDEIKIKKLGEVTVITDLEHRTLYDMILGRNQAQLTEYFKGLPDADKVLWVCTDMYRPFEKSIADAMPNASWVIDHFHLVAYANRAVDAVRVEIQKNMTKKNRIKTKHGLAYTLRTRAKDLSSENAAKIRGCRTNPALAPLAIAYDLKEDFFNIYSDLSSKENAQQKFEVWANSIPDDDLYKGFRDLVKTVRNFYEQIFNYWDCPIAITNGFTECTNRIIREKNVRGRGHSFEILRGRTLFRKANLLAIMEHNLTYTGPAIPNKGPVFTYEETNAGTATQPVVGPTNGRNLWMIRSAG